MTQSLTPRFETGRPMLLAGLRAHYTFDDMPHGLIAAWSRFAPALPLPGQVGVVTYGAMCGSDVPNRRFEYMCAVEVGSFDGIGPEWGRMRVPQAYYAVFTHDGPIDQLPLTWAGVHHWLGSSGATGAPTPDFERYDDRFDPGAGQGIVEIWVPVIHE